MLNRNDYPQIREASDADYEAIWSIWMQDHVIQWMSFTKNDKESFRNNFKRMAAASTIYVLVDKIEKEEKIVAVQRIKFGTNETAHCAEYCSLGVHKDYQGRGYAKMLHSGFEEICRSRGIKRIQLTQSGGNGAAFHIADSYGFHDEAIFPDWLKRDKNNGSYYLIERYRYQLIDEELQKLASNIPSLRFTETLPSLVSTDAVNSNNFKVIKEGDVFRCMMNGKKLLEVGYEPDDSVIRHIAFLTINFADENHPKETVSALQVILQSIMSEERVMKCELFVSKPHHAQMCQNAGFFVRGEKKASLYIDGKFQNELGCEYSFLGINDACLLITSQIANADHANNILEKLDACRNAIKLIANENNYSNLGSKYLENITYQITRDNLANEFVISLNSTTNIEYLLNKLPKELIKPLEELKAAIGLAAIKPKHQSHLVSESIFSHEVMSPDSKINERNSEFISKKNQ